MPASSDAARVGDVWRREKKRQRPFRKMVGKERRWPLPGWLHTVRLC